MRDLGAEQYSIPTEFRDQVEVHVNRFRGPDRINVERALIQERDKLELIRGLLEKENLPTEKRQFGRCGRSLAVRSGHRPGLWSDGQ